MGKLSDVERAIISIELERSRLDREKSMLVLNKAMFLYFSFLFVGILGFVNQYLTQKMLNLLVIMGLIVLIVGTLPYINIMASEGKKLDKMISELRKKHGGK
jgi:uncharacterized membrane protein (DUF485 family)